jgi:hypothetical protein
MGETRAKENACISIFPYPGHEVNVFNGKALNPGRPSRG